MSCVSRKYLNYVSLIRGVPIRSDLIQREVRIDLCCVSSVCRKSDHMRRRLQGEPISLGGQQQTTPPSSGSGRATSPVLPSSSQWKWKCWRRPACSCLGRSQILAYSRAEVCSIQCSPLRDNSNSKGSNVLLHALMTLHFFCWADKIVSLQLSMCNVSIMDCPAKLDICPFKIRPGLSLRKFNLQSDDCPSLFCMVQKGAQCSNVVVLVFVQNPSPCHCTCSTRQPIKCTSR